MPVYTGIKYTGHSQWPHKTVQLKNKRISPLATMRTLNTKTDKLLTNDRCKV